MVVIYVASVGVYQCDMDMQDIAEILLSSLALRMYELIFYAW